MKLLASAALASVIASGASATFVDLVVTKVQNSTGGVDLDVYTLWARFDGATDTVLNAYNLNGLNGAVMNAFYHKDTASYNSGVLMTEYGTWAPQSTGSATLNRPFDSYLTIGGNPLGTNTTNADPSWGGAGWTRPDLPNGLNIGWFNSNPPNLQGRVGNTGNTATDVRLGQFVVARDFTAGEFSLTLGYNNGVSGSPVQFADDTFFIGVPAPGAIALLGLAGLAGRRRR